MSEWTDWTPVEGFDTQEIIYEKRQRMRDGEPAGGVARILFNRPESMNAFTLDTSAEMVDALNDANLDKTIGVIVLSHTGPHFGVGGDVNQLGANTGRNMNRGGVIPDIVIKQCFKPIIAAVRGYVIGMHHHMAYHCDFTVAGESTIFGQNGPRVGSPASGRVVAYSAHVMGMKRARELWIRCRQLTAQEALERGLCNVVVQDRLIEDEVEKWCDEMLDLVPICLAAVKQSFEAVDASLQYSDNFLGMIQPGYTQRPEVIEAGRAFFERRPPQYWTPELVETRF